MSRRDYRTFFVPNMLLPLLRPAALRLLPRHIRTVTYDISSGGFNGASPTDQKTLQEAAELINAPVNASAVAEPDDLDAVFLPFLPPVKPKEPFMNIPPAEDPLLHLLASCIMKGGKRSRASGIVSRTLLHIHAYTRAPALPILRQAIFSLAPTVRCMSQKHSTKTINRPIPLSEKQSIRAAIALLLKSVDNRNTGDMLEERLARELIDIITNPENGSMKRKAEAHKFAMINR